MVHELVEENIANYGIHLGEMIAEGRNNAYSWMENEKQKYAAFTMHLSRQNGEIVVDVVFVPATCWKDADATSKRISMNDYEFEEESFWVNPDLN